MKIGSLVDYAKDLVGGLATGKTPTQMVANAVSKVLGIEPEDGKSYSPEQELQIELKEMDVRAQLEIDANDLRKAEMLDTQDARKNRDKDGPLKWFLPGLTVLTTVMYGIVMYVVLTSEVPAGSEKVAYTLLGQFAGVVVTMFGFWYGSSKGSKDKDAK